ncbi:hypothetical protein M406DRAFT_326712 [Cryphonectria parasitica EP155]|uniref:Uncharacterized protein n=1 Tax=Cryphonectria parasitica (strain ATCC 38755 / EP155) TaxID=660469 RepID=A0A9P4YER5_CRYP1|nr:uncharacterized protein M406DRAFT_326712 [Cryphonectria parasitica EP155]KAF3771327.1 hypothetical protein M406DRAFT_326712 [Cryphonectria parasitica EP155]
MYRGTIQGLYIVHMPDQSRELWVARLSQKFKAAPWAWISEARPSTAATRAPYREGEGSNITVDEYVASCREGFDLIPEAFKGGPLLQKRDMYESILDRGQDSSPLDNVLVLQDEYMARQFPVDRI